MLGVARDVARSSPTRSRSTGSASSRGPAACPPRSRPRSPRPSGSTRLALVSGPGPLDEVPGGWEALGDYRRPTAEMARREPHRSARSVARHMEPYLARPGVVPRQPARARRRGVRRIRSSARCSSAQVTAAIAPGPDGIAADLVAMWLPWGFALGDVAVPTTVFHAALDPHNEADAHDLRRADPGRAARGVARRRAPRHPRPLARGARERHRPGGLTRLAASAGAPVR